MQPTFYIPHGAGPCFFMDWNRGPADTWDRMEAWLRQLVTGLEERPSALLIVSAHWEAPVVSVLSSPEPPMLYDYTGFPEHTYALDWPAPGDPQLAARVLQHLSDAGIPGATDPTRGFDHGTFIPMLLSVPDADLPTIQVSLHHDLDPAAHLALGQALAPLRAQDVLIIGSGMSYHSFQGFGRPRGTAESATFDAWLQQTVALPEAERNARLAAWDSAPAGRASHPREEHLLPLHVCAGAAGEDRGHVVFTDQVMDVTVSGVRFG